MGSQSVSVEFDPVAWEALCLELSDEAAPGCGHVYELYVARLGPLIDKAMSRFKEDDRAAAIDIARRYDYFTAEELAEPSGWCPHWLDPSNCPVCCGPIGV